MRRVLSLPFRSRPLSFSRKSFAEDKGDVENMSIVQVCIFFIFIFIFFVYFFIFFSFLLTHQKKKKKIRRSTVRWTLLWKAIRKVVCLAKTWPLEACFVLRLVSETNTVPIACSTPPFANRFAL